LEPRHHQYHHQHNLTKQVADFQQQRDSSETRERSRSRPNPSEPEHPPKQKPPEPEGPPTGHFGDDVPFNVSFDQSQVDHAELDRLVAGIGCGGGRGGGGVGAIYGPALC